MNDVQLQKDNQSQLKIDTKKYEEEKDLNKDVDVITNLVLQGRDFEADKIARGSPLKQK